MGNGGKDTLSGGGLNDTLNGNGGDDVIKRRHPKAIPDQWWQRQ